MKKFPWKQIFVILVLGVGVFIVVEMFKAYQDLKDKIARGEKTFWDVVMAPWTAAKAVWSAGSAAVSNVASGAVAVGQLPGLTQTALSNAADQNTVADSYQPGGTEYNTILDTYGQSAADNAAAQSAQNAATEQAQANADASWFGLGNLYQYL